MREVDRNHWLMALTTKVRTIIDPRAQEFFVFNAFGARVSGSQFWMAFPAQAVGLLKGEAHNATAMRNPIAAKLLLVADSLRPVLRKGLKRSPHELIAVSGATHRFTKNQVHDMRRNLQC